MNRRSFLAGLCLALSSGACGGEGAARHGAPFVAAPPSPAGDAISPSTPTRLASPIPYSVRFVYLVSADTQPRESFRRTIETAARDVQDYYRRQVGDTFVLNTPVVEVVRSDKPASWFYATPTTRSENQEDRGYYNTLEEVTRLLGAERNQPFRWVIYSDGPGNKGRGGDGVAVLPNDGGFDALMANPTQDAWSRWSGGLAHELGHALGLPEAAPDAQGTVMGEWWSYPRLGLAPADVAFLRGSVFIGTTQTRLGTFAYPGGRFERRLHGGRVVWAEVTDSGSLFQFVERPSLDLSTFWLLDERRSIQIRVPVLGGMSRIASAQAAWADLYPVRLML